MTKTPGDDHASLFTALLLAALSAGGLQRLQLDLRMQLLGGGSSKFFVLQLDGALANHLQG